MVMSKDDLLKIEREYRGATSYYAVPLLLGEVYELQHQLAQQLAADVHMLPVESEVKAKKK